jgi:hypothetical protein
MNGKGAALEGRLCRDGTVVCAPRLLGMGGWWLTLNLWSTSGGEDVSVGNDGSVTRNVILTADTPPLHFRQFA